MPLVAADVAWMLTATALVLLMTPALGFFYGGLVRSKNALNTMMMSVCALGFVGVAWALAGYSLAFAPGNPAVGGLSYAFLRGEVGDDKIFVVPVEKVYRIRTGEEDQAAVTPVAIPEMV